MRAGERGEYQLADIGLARVDAHVGAALVNVAEPGEIAEIELRVNALGEHIQAHGHDVHVARALTIAEERALHALRARQQRQFACRHAAAAVVVGVNADDRRFTVFQVTDEVFDLVGIGVGRTHLDRVGQVEDNGILLGRAKLLHYAVTDGNRVVGLGAAEALGGVFKADVRVARVFVGELLDQARALHRDVDDALHVGFEHDLPLQGRGGVVEVNDDVFGALDGLKGLVDQVLARLNQYLNGHIVGNVVLFNQLTTDFVFRFRRAGKTDFDFLKAHVHQRVEEFELFFKVHRVNQRLIAVAQIHTAPDGRLGDGIVRPCAVGKGNLLERNVLFIRRFHFIASKDIVAKKAP